MSHAFIASLVNSTQGLTVEKLTLVGHPVIVQEPVQPEIHTLEVIKAVLPLLQVLIEIVTNPQHKVIEAVLALPMLPQAVIMRLM